jgi:hypothetical protein
MKKAAFWYQAGLSARFFGADDSNFYLAVASGAGYIQGDRLLHDTLGDCRDDGIDVIQPPVQSIEPLGDPLYILTVACCFQFISFCQSSHPLESKIKFIISPEG